MTIKLLQPGRGDRRDIVIVYHLDPAASTIQGRIRSAIGADATLVNDTSAKPGYYMSPAKLASTVEWALKESGALATGRIVLAGFSAGCQAVRAHLLAGERPDAVVAADGTHASTNPVTSAQIKPWRDYAEGARGGDGTVLIASHTHIQPPTFMSTRDTLRLITGWPLDVPEGRHSEVGLVVYSWPGKAAPDHIEQAQVALPRMLAEAFTMMGAAPVEAPAPPLTPIQPPASFALALSRAAQADLALMHREVGHNAGPWVTKLLARFGLKPPNNYCSAGVSEWLAVAAKAVGRPSPVAGSPGAKALMGQFQAANLFVPAKNAKGRVEEGMVAFWHRGPPGAWTGHTGVVVQAVGDSFFTVEANGPAPSDFAVAMVERHFNDPLLLGFGRCE